MMQQVKALRWLGIVLSLSACTALTDMQMAATDASSQKDKTAPQLSVEQRLDRLEVDLALVMRDLAVLLERGGSIPLANDASALRKGQSEAIDQQITTGGLPIPAVKALPEEDLAAVQTMSLRTNPDSSGVTGTHAVHLASYKSLESLMAGRDLAQKNLGNILKKLDFYADPVLVSGELFYRLKAGPVVSADVANQICQDIREKGAFCAISLFSDPS